MQFSYSTFAIDLIDKLANSLFIETLEFADKAVHFDSFMLIKRVNKR